MSDGFDKLTTDETKIVITLNGTTTVAAVGIQRPNCDPAFFKVEGDLAVALTAVPGLLEEAVRRWATSPRYPRSLLPPSSQSQPATVTTTSLSKNTTAKPQLQPRIF